MALCWELRGCDEEMQADCLHHTTIHDQCPTKCAFTNCQNPQRVLTTDPMLIFDPTVDRSAAIKEVCLHCAFFIKNGPRREDVRSG